MSRIIPDREKMKELIVYVAGRCEADETFGAVKLNKVLFYADFLAYLQLGCPITGMEYQALENGPAPRQLLPLRDELVSEGRLLIKHHDHYGFVQNKPIANGPADLSKFSPDEISLVDCTIQQLWERSAKEVSNLTHRFVGWQLAALGETIPYSVALVEAREPTLSERVRANSLSARAAAFLAR